MRVSSKRFCGALALLIASGPFNLAAAASGFTSSPGQVQYNYASPQVSIYAGVQIGGNVSTSVTQASSANVAGSVQSGTKTSANISQTGSVNNSFVSQYSSKNAAFVTQFGPSSSLLSQ